jgi:carbon monoxide dehydrogenase subunit G
MKATVTSRITIAAKPKEVFRYLADPELHYLWNPHLRSVASRGKLKQDATYSTTSMMLGVKIENDNHITNFKADEVIEIQSRGGTIEFRVEYRLRPQGIATAVECNTTVVATGKAFAFAKPVLTLLAQRELQSDLQALKIAVEQKLN